MLPRSAKAIDHRGCLRRRMWPLAESAGSPCMWLGRRRSCGMAGMRRVRSSSPRTPRMGRAQIPGLGIAGQVCHDCANGMPPGSARNGYVCPRARPASNSQRPAPADPASTSPPGVRGRLPAPRSDHARLFRLSHVPALLAAELGNARRVIVLPIESPNDRQKPQVPVLRHVLCRADPRAWPGAGRRRLGAACRPGRVSPGREDRSRRLR